MTSILVFGEVQGGALQSVSLELVSAANGLVGTGGVQGALIGGNLGSAIESFSADGLSKVFVAEDAGLQAFDADRYVSAARALIEAASPDLVLLPHTADVSEWVPRLAARLGASLVTNCNALVQDEGGIAAIKPNCGGAFTSTYRLERSLKIVTLAGGSYPAAPVGKPTAVEAVAVALDPLRVEVLETIGEDRGTGPALKTARVVVAGGIGVGGAEQWHHIEDAAAKLGAAVGASRAAVDMGWVPSSRQVGFSGLKVNAELYIAAGISGAIHHLAGLGRVKTVVAINEDEEANIFSVAQFAVVGDLKQVLPAFTARVNELKGH